jgi:hypothetical protein
MCIYYIMPLMYAKKPFDAAPRSQKIITRTTKKIPSDRSKILIFLTLVQWACLLNFAQISPHGTAKEEYRILLVINLRLRSCPGLGYRRPF